MIPGIIAQGGFIPLAGGGSESHRYWKIGDLYSEANTGYVEAAELWLQSGGVDIGPPIDHAESSHYDSFSVVPSSYDGLTTTRWMTVNGSDGVAYVAFDYGADVTPDAIRIQATTTDVVNRTIRNGVIYYSDTGLTGPWVPLTRFDCHAAGGNWSSGEERSLPFNTPPVYVIGGARFWAYRNMVGSGGFTSLGEMVFRAGGTDIAPLASIASAPYDATSYKEAAYDGNLATRYMTRASGTGINMIYDFGGPVNPDTLSVKAPTTDIAARTATGGVVSWSNDGLTWTDIATPAFSTFTSGVEQTVSWTPLV